MRCAKAAPIMGQIPPPSEHTRISVATRHEESPAILTDDRACHNT